MSTFAGLRTLISPPRTSVPGQALSWLSALFVLALFGLIWAMLQGVQYRQPEPTDLATFGTVQWIGVYLFTNYLYPFELTSILLLVAAIGAIYLSRKEGDDR